MNFLTAFFGWIRYSFIPPFSNHTTMDPDQFQSLLFPITLFGGALLLGIFFQILVRLLQEIRAWIRLMVMTMVMLAGISFLLAPEATIHFFNLLFDLLRIGLQLLLRLLGILVEDSEPVVLI